MKQRCHTGEINLYYGDETQISEEGYMPYGWQFRDENISIGSAGGKKINCFGMITKDNLFHYKTTCEMIDSHFITEHLERFSFKIKNNKR